MLYGRLNNNKVVEIIDQDPTGRYAAEIQWVEIDPDLGLLTTKAKHELFTEVMAAQNEQIKVDKIQIENAVKTTNEKISFIQLEREKLNVAGVDIESLWHAHQNPVIEEEAEEE